MLASTGQAVTPRWIHQQQRELDACVGEVDAAAKRAQKSSAQALGLAEKWRAFGEATRPLGRPKGRATSDRRAPSADYTRPEPTNS